MNERILIVDDEEGLRTAMQHQLREAGFTVDTVESGETALASMKEKSYDAVLLDIRMPGMDGLQVLHRVVKEYPTTEVMMMTGFADFVDAVESLKSGARDYLVKPVHPIELVARLNGIFKDRELRMTIRELQRNFSSVALHSLLSPINSMRSIMDHVIKGRSGMLSKEQSYLLTYARNLGDKTINTMRHLSGFSGTNGTKPLSQEKKIIDIGILAESVVIRFEILARPKEIQMKKIISRPLPQVMCVPDSIIQALNNILDYSLENSIPEGTISLTIVKEIDKTADDNGNARVKITIRDSGVGVANEGLSHVLDEDGKNDENSDFSPDLSIAEIGLAISKHIIEDHGGTFELNFDPGSGNIFVVTLPAAE
jgi:two-component system, NtrC family, sensor kinase